MTKPQILACFHCIHMQIANQTANMQCHSISVCGIKLAQTEGAPVSEARDTSGPCGPEARFLTIKENQCLK